MAVRTDDLNRVIKLLAKGADVNTKGLADTTPLMFATMSGYEQTVKVLLAAGADVNAQNVEGTTAIMFAAMKTNVEIVKALIAAGADVNAKVGNSTVLDFARNPEIISLLEAAGARK